jgi:tetratricopeptide (TPR) repeat protein
MHVEVVSDSKPQKTKVVVRIILVSPGDVQAERDLLPGIIDELNRGLAGACGLTLELLRWETDAYPGFHVDGPQGLIDDVLGIEAGDLVVGIFWKRFGTPTPDADSGTEHELRKAFQAWESNKCPQVMVYFNEEPYSPKSKAELDQWGKVMSFKESFPKKGLWWPYHGKLEFEKLCRNHLTNFLLKSFTDQKSSPSAPPESAFFEAPQFTNQVPRSSLLALLKNKITNNSVVAVEGLAGSGKTYLVTSYVSREQQTPETMKTLWHDPCQGETLDDFLAHIGMQIHLSGFSIFSKCKELMGLLRERNTLLVIDDFQEVDAVSFRILINAAVRHSGPANLLLISRTYVDLLRNIPEIGHLVVRGFNIEEMRGFLWKRDVKRLNHTTIESLISKTDGLPLAASLFATLVHDFNRDPQDLLSDAILNTEPLKGWFSEVSSLIKAKERKLLTTLSICDGPFNMSAVRVLGKQENITEVDQAFESLQRSYLVQKYSPYRWSIHHLIAEFCHLGLKEDDRKRIHLALGRYYLKGFRIGRGPRSILLSDIEFRWKVRACRQYQLAGDHKKSQAIIHDLSKTAKTRGYYDTLIHLSRPELSPDIERSGWIDYHYAHCCLITGLLTEGLVRIERLIYAPGQLGVGERVAFTRLYAEIIGSMGRPKSALDKLRGVLRSIRPPDQIRPQVLAQAKSVEVWLLTTLEQYEEAKELATLSLEDSLRRQDGIGQAVALTRLGILHQLSNYPEQAQEKLKQAGTLFREREDRRGLAWSLSYVALTDLDLDNEEGAVKHLQEAVRIEFDIGGCSTDYLMVLRTVKERTKNKEILKLADTELRRIGFMLDRPASGMALDN